jgi:hypothetical protein
MKIHLTFRGVLAAFAGALAFAAASFAGASSLSQPEDKPILTVAGSIGVTNKNGTAQFDRQMLEALGSVSFETTTPWYSGPVTFEGVPLAKVMAAVAAKGETLVVVALNNYSAEVPMEDALKYNVILAYKRNGEYMTVRDKGPLFIVYPYDSMPELKNQKFYSRSVWQLSRIEVR